MYLHIWAQLYDYVSEKVPQEGEEEQAKQVAGKNSRGERGTETN